MALSRFSLFPVHVPAGSATPTAVMSGVGRAAGLGILFRDGKIMESVAGIRTLVFDKTGTLTTGNFEIAGD
ncbi:MAG: hypothetical protein R2850_11060 [Bacteroidia bacterium]